MLNNSANQTLTKQSGENEIRSYFNAILELSKSDNEFSVNLDNVWMLVYAAKEKAVRALKENFIEHIDYQILAQNGEKSEKEDHLLTTIFPSLAWSSSLPAKHHISIIE